LDFLDSILSNIDEALIVMDSRGRILFFNEVALNLSKEILEKPLKEGDNMVQVVSRSQKEVVREIIRAIELKKQTERSFAEYPNRQGTTLYLEFHYVPVTDENSEILYIHLFIRDITPQKIFEMKLTTQAANISHLIDKANAIIIGVDTRGYITDWNEYCSKITGFEKDEVYAQKFTDILLTKEEKYFDDLLAKVMLNESVSNYEIPVRTKFKKKAIFLLNGTHRTTPTHEVTGILFVGQDITELSDYRESLERKVQERTKELQQALRNEKEVVDMKSRFVSIASHEFRTPLSSIEYAVNAIRNPTRGLDEQELRDRLNSIDKQIKHMMALLDDILIYDKSQAGKIQLVVSDIHLGEFLKNVTEDVGHNTKGTHKILLEVDQLPEKIASDEKLFRNVLINLLTNAIKFSPGKPHVYLTVKREGKQLHLTVRDEGMGIPENELNKIFEAFVRGKNTTFIQGTGLGLSIVKKAVELLEGRIQVESKIEKGTTFTVTIPIP
jgi:PAS domain S-box-containing protein